MTTETPDAIQSDVPTPENEQPAERPKSRREEAMEAIEAAHAARMSEETGVPVETLTASIATPTEEEAPAVKGEDSADDVDAQLNAQLNDGGPKVIDQVDGLKVKVKVDGEESEVLLADVLRSYQKGSAADRRLEEATRLLREAEARAAASPAPAPASQAAPAPQEQAGDELVGQAKQALSKLYEGDEDAAAQLLAQMMTNVKGAPAATPAQPDIDELTSAMEQRLAVKSAFAKIQTDYPAVLADPDLDTLTTTKAKAKEAAGKPRSEAMLEAAQEVYQLIGRKPAGRPATEVSQTTRDEKLARKADLDQLPVANASSTGVTAEDTSPTAVIAAMAQRRLGQSLPKGI